MAGAEIVVLLAARAEVPQHRDAGQDEHAHARHRRETHGVAEGGGALRRESLDLGEIEDEELRLAGEHAAHRVPEVVAGGAVEAPGGDQVNTVSAHLNPIGQRRHSMIIYLHISD
jgi:hypothetical protein